MSIRGIAFAAIALALCTASARADISFVDAFRNVANLQTGDGNTLSANGAFYSADLNATTANNYSAVQMTYPGPGSPVSLTQTTPTVYHFQTPGLSKAAMDAAFPFGSYQFSATNGATVNTTSFQYTSDDYAQSLPYLTGTDYTSLQGMDPTGSFTFHISPFVTGSQASVSFLFLTIFDFDTNAFVFNAGFLAASTTSVVLPANTLAPGHHFAYEIDFSNRDLVPSPGTQFQAQLGFDVRTDGLFMTAATTAVPEPSTAAVAVFGAISGVAYGWSRRRRDQRR
jgi:hypothetical protein